MGSILVKYKKVCFKRCVWKVGSWEKQFGRGDQILEQKD
jgi:hypothetical protein